MKLQIPVEDWNSRMVILKLKMSVAGQVLLFGKGLKNSLFFL